MSIFESLANGISHFVGNVVHGVASGFRAMTHAAGEAIRKFSNWVSDQILNAKKLAAAQRHSFEQATAQFMSSDTGALVSLLALIAAVVGIIVASATGIGNKIFQKVAQFVNAIEKGVGSILEMLHYRELLVAHKILMIVWSDYRKAMTQIFQAMGNLSEELGYGTDTLTLLFFNIKTLVYDTYSMMGLSTEDKELIWFDSFSNFMRRIDTLFARYAYTPGVLLDDIDEYIVRPHSKAASNSMNGLFNDVKNITDTVESTVDSIEKLKDDMHNLINDLPDEIAKAVDKRWKPIEDTWNDFYDNKYTPFVDKVNGILDAINTAIERERMRGDEFENYISHPADMFENIDLLSEDEQLEQYRILDDYSGRYSEILASQSSEGIAVNYAHMRAIAELLQTYVPPEKVLSLEPITTRGFPQVKGEERKTWFVGDY